MRGLELAHRLEHGFVELRLVGAGLNVEALSQQRDLLVLHAEFEHRPFGDDDHVGLRLFDLAAAELEQLLPERFELRLVWLEAPKIGGGIGADGNKFSTSDGLGSANRRIEFFSAAAARCGRRAHLWHSPARHS